MYTFYCATVFEIKNIGEKVGSAKGGLIMCVSGCKDELTGCSALNWSLGNKYSLVHFVNDSISACLRGSCGCSENQCFGMELIRSAPSDCNRYRV